MSSKCQASDKCFSDTALCLIIIGVIMALTGLLWPVSPTYKLDINRTAEENERMEAKHAQLLMTIYSVMVIGMAFVLVGALITSGLLMKSIITERLLPSVRNTNNHSLTQQLPPPQQAIDIPINSRSVSWTQQELISLPRFPPYQGTRRESRTRLSESDQLEMNRCYANKKPYGSVD